MRTRATVAILVAALALTAGCRSMTGQSLGTNIDNTTTTATVKAQLAAERVQNLGWVDVDTSAGTVYLSGTAETEAQKRRAGEIAADVDGVKRVVNNIQVRSSTAMGSGAQSAQSASPAAAPAGMAAGRYTATGEVVAVDQSTGNLTMRTSEGQLMLRVPEGTLRDIRVGDRVSVDFGIRPVR